MATLVTNDHSTHGRESPEETPNLTHCPCCGHGPEKQAECAKAGCGYCSLMVEIPTELAEKLVMLVGRRTAIDLCAIAPSVMEDPPGRRDVHHRLTEITDDLFGPAPTMPLEALLERLEKAVPTLKKALWDDEDSDEDTPIIFAALAAMVADVHAPQDLLTEDQWERAEVMFNEMNAPKGAPCPVCRGRKVVQGAFETPCTNCNGTGISPQIPREGWKGHPLGECCIAGRCDGVRCACPCHPKAERPRGE